MISIDTYTSGEDQAIRSIRSTDTPSLLHGSNHCATYEEQLLSELEQFRSKAIESISASLTEVIQNVAMTVLARELPISAADVQTLVQRELRRFERESPVRLRVSPRDVSTVRTELPIIADATLSPGALVLELRDGAGESRLPVRLSCAADRMDNPSVSSLHGEVFPELSF